MKDRTCQSPFSVAFIIGLAAGALALWQLGTAQPKAPAPPAAETPPDTGIELSRQSSSFIEITAVQKETNQIWGRPLPSRISLQTAARVSLGAIVDGRVEQVLVRPGDRVLAGCPLLKIQSAAAGQARAEEEAAAAHLASAEENLRRFKSMLAKGVGTELELFEAEMKVRETRIDAERTRKANLLLGPGKGPEIILAAPADGIVLSVSANTGSALQPGNEVVEIGDPARVWIEAEVSEDDAFHISRGQSALIEAPRLGHSIKAKVETVGGHIDPATRRRRIYIAPEGSIPDWLAPGMFVEARLGQPQGQLLLPAEAVLIKEGDRRVVYIQKDDGRFYPRDVLVNSALGGRVQVLKGLEPGERVVTKGALLVDGRSEQLL